MNTLTRAGITKSGALIGTAISLSGIALTVAFFLFHEVAAAFLTLFVIFLGLLLTFLLSRVASHLGSLKTMSRSLDKRVSKNLLPVVRDLHRQISEVTGDESSVYLSASSESLDVAGRKEFDELKNLLKDKDDLENQVLRQIVAEARLIRMAVEGKDEHTGK